MTNSQTNEIQMSQQERIQQMKDELAAIGGEIVTFEEVPADVEEELLRQSLGRPETESPFYGLV